MRASRLVPSLLAGSLIIGLLAFQNCAGPDEIQSDYWQKGQASNLGTTPPTYTTPPPATSPAPAPQPAPQQAAQATWKSTGPIEGGPNSPPVPYMRGEGYCEQISGFAFGAPCASVAQTCYSTSGVGAVCQ